MHKTQEEVSNGFFSWLDELFLGSDQIEHASIQHKKRRQNVTLQNF